MRRRHCFALQVTPRRLAIQAIVRDCNSPMAQTGEHWPAGVPWLHVRALSGRHRTIDTADGSEM